MSETFLELVPKSAISLRQSMTELEASGLPFDGYNLPELRRKDQQFLQPEELMQMRLEGSISEKKQLTLHLRTRERSVQETIDRLRLATRSGVDLALLVTGDPLAEADSFCMHAQNVLPMLSKTPLKIAVGADLYQPHWGRWGQKIDAIHSGIVDAVFTQPIFDPSVFHDIDERTRDLLPRERSEERRVGKECRL